MSGVAMLMVAPAVGASKIPSVIEYTYRHPNMAETAAIVVGARMHVDGRSDQ